MRVRDLMTRYVITVEPTDKVTDILHIMEEKKFHRAPVVDHGRLIGIVTATDMERVSPSEATTLSRHELIYLWSKITVKDAMPAGQKLYTISPDEFLEEAAYLMKKYHIGALPVIENGKLVGIISETDVLNGLIRLTHVSSPHTCIDILTPSKVGIIADIARILAEENLSIANINVYQEDEESVHLVFRIYGQNCDHVIELLKEKDYDIVAVKKLP